MGEPRPTETEHAAGCGGHSAPPCAASRCHAAALGAAEEARPRRGARGEVGARERAAGADDDGAGRPRAGEAVDERAELEPSSSAAGGDSTHIQIDIQIDTLYRYNPATGTLAPSPEPGPLSPGPGTCSRTHPRRRSGRLATGLARRPLRPSRCARVR